MIIELKEPLKHGETVHTQLELREPTIGQCLQCYKHLAVFDAASVIQFDISLVAAVSGIPEILIGELPARPLAKAAAYLRTFPVLNDGEEVVTVAENDECITLPITASFAGERLSEITIREPKAREKRDAFKEANEPSILSQTNAALSLLSVVTGKKKELLKTMPVSDFRKADQILRFFIADFPLTPEN